MLGSTELSPNSASSVGSAVLNPGDWGQCNLCCEVQPLFSSSALSLPSFFFGGVVVGWHLCKYDVACAAVMDTSASWFQQALMLCFSNDLDVAIWGTEKLIPSTYHPLKKKITASMFVVCVLYYSLSDSFISILIKTDLAKLIRGNLHSSYSLFTYLWTANCRNAICSLKFPIFAHFPFDSIVVKESCA